MRAPPAVAVYVSLCAALGCAAAVGAPPEAGVAKPGEARAALLERLSRLNRSDQFLFGQEHATLWGMWLDGGLVPTGKWFEGTAKAGRFTSDAAAVVGDDPAVLGVSLGMLAFEPPGWGRRPVVAAAIRRQGAAGGVVTMDWHAPSCNTAGPPGEKLGSVEVEVAGGGDAAGGGKREVAIHVVPGGSSFYAEEEYGRPIASRADVPETLKCLCQIANDRPLTAGAYAGLPGKSWLVAQAKHAARVMRDEKLGGLPIIVRPFHEHTGAWFWWGQPYWDCAALLDAPGAVSGPDAFKAVNRTFVEALRAEPGMSDLVFAYSPDKLVTRRGPAAREEEERAAPALRRARDKVQDPTGFARDRLRERLVRELEAAKLAWASPAQRGLKTPAQRASSAKAATAYVAERRPFYAEAYAGDDVFDVLGLDVYHPSGRPGTDADGKRIGLQLRVVAAEAQARGKPWALTETGSYRLHLQALAAGAAPGAPITVHAQKDVEDALARLFDPADRAALLRHYGMKAPAPVTLTAADRALVVPRPSEESWFTGQLLPLAREAHVAYAMVWQTYYDPTAVAAGRYAYYYVPYPGHPEAADFAQFYKDPSTCFLRDNCLAPSSSSFPSSSPSPTPATYRLLADAAEAALRRDVLDVWFPRAVDRAHGGFLQDFARDWSAAPARDGKFSVFQARMTWLASRAALTRPDQRERFLPIARHGFAYLRDVLWDRQAGGFYWGLDDGGKVAARYTDGKHLYGNAFCLYALAAYYQASKDPAALDLAQRAFRWIDEHAHDAAHGGYFEWLTRAGVPVPARPDGGRLTERDRVPFAGFPIGYKSMNTHLHLLEALTELLAVWKDDAVRRRADELLVVLRDRVSAAPGVMNLYLTGDWVALPDHDSYGHDVEAAYLMLEAEDALAASPAAAASRARTARMARMLVDHALAYGRDAKRGGLYRDGTTAGPAEDRQKEWWAQAEALNAYLLMHEQHGATTDAYWKAFLEQWTFLTDHQIDPQSHGLFEMLDEENNPVPAWPAKARMWKEGYHEGRALMNVAARLRRLAH